MATTTDPTTPTLFRFTIHTGTSTAHLNHTHPIPSFLHQPTPLQAANPAFKTAFIDVLSLITSQHHDQCMTLLHQSICLSCNCPTTDCLKSPSSFLHLVDPLVVIYVYPVCGSPVCANAVRRQLLQLQAATREREEEEEGKIYGKMLCQVCGKDGAKRCAGCGKVGYCGKGCQSMGWKEHRRECGRGHKPNKKREEGEGEGMKVPYETI